MKRIRDRWRDSFLVVHNEICKHLMSEGSRITVMPLGPEEVPSSNLDRPAFFILGMIVQSLLLTLLSYQTAKLLESWIGIKFKD